MTANARHASRRARVRYGRQSNDSSTPRPASDSRTISCRRRHAQASRAASVTAHPPAAIVTAARQAAEAAMTAGVPAVQIAVSAPRSIIYSEAFGVTDQESATAATPRSVMQIGSVTKQFTAAAILRLAERGALTLDDRIEKFVPGVRPPRSDDHTAAPPQPHVGSSSRAGTHAGPPWQDSSRRSRVSRPSRALNNGQPLDFAPGAAVELQQRRLHAARLCDRIDHGQVVRRFHPS